MSSAQTFAMQPTITRTAVEILDALRLLYLERALAQHDEGAYDDGYMADLLDDIQAHKSALAGAVVTEIASLRAELSEPLHG